ncbi:tetratricopeptide repeat protein [Hymenobacter sp. BT683]|uniref:Tetratricopeptide repeat protein n=1 Tax=Hymenobacter jeongseonensis TaxID=2791027 RepID=A0ABS0IMQ4_9BACT|nr:tetratricopeptide repeat protein [Hymenobacter jeongseonensis]MBF9239075.1 tetratricopeptide repeat protein [Hymenobacter jeongseonensis]
MLDELFARLRLATAPAEIEVLQDGIWQLWLTTDNVAIDKAMEEGLRALQAEDYTRAIEYFTRIIQVNPSFAEAWNKRATAHYLRGEYRASLDDIRETLHREPRHFGALWGQAGMLRQLGDYARALRVLNRLSVICPHLPGLQKQLLEVREQLEEDGL